MSDLSETIKNLALECGYGDCGITTAEPFTEFENAVKKRMADFPEAAHHYEGMLKRVDPRAKNPWAKSVIVGIIQYGKFEIPDTLEGKIGKHYLFDRRYAGCTDYDIPAKFKQGLKDLGLKVRKGGVPDRWAAARAGVGRFGQNNFIHSEKFGTWINIEPWLVDAELPADTPTLESPCPENCRACIKACPTGALCNPFSMRMDHCIAYLTYAEELPLNPQLETNMGEWIYGCDVCQDVCPLNKDKWDPRKPAPWLTEHLNTLTQEALAEMDMDTYIKTVHPLFWYISDNEDGLNRWKANAERSLLHKGKE